MVHDGAAAGVDDQVVPHGRDAEIVAQLLRGVDLVCAGRDHLDQDHRIDHLDDVRPQPLAATDQGVGLVDRVRIDPHRHAVGVGPAGQPGSADRLPQGDYDLQLALVVAGPLGRHRDHLPGDQLVTAALRLGHRPGDELVGGHAGAGWNGHRGLPCG